MIGYINAFHLLALTAAVAMPLVWLMRGTPRLRRTSAPESRSDRSAALPALPPPPIRVRLAQFSSCAWRKPSHHQAELDAGGLVVLIAKGVQALQYLRYGSGLGRRRRGERQHQNAADYQNTNHRSASPLRSAKPEHSIDTMRFT